MQELCASNRVFAGARALPAARRTAVPAVARLPARRRSGAPALAAAARHAPHGCSCCAHDAGVASPSGRGALGLGAAPPLARQQQLARGRRGAAVAAAAAPGATPEATASCGAAWQQQQLQRMFSKHQHAQQAHEQAAAPAAPPAPAPAPAARPPPFAALTRLLLTGQNSYYFRNALTQRRAGGGPISLLLFVLTIVAAMVAAVRGALVRKVKACKTCRGFGVCRCRLCNGEGRVDWAAKLSHYDVCPLCMNRRYVVCSECGGFYHRPLFHHMRRNPSRPEEAGDVYALAVDGAGAPVAGGSFNMKETLGGARND